MTADAKVKLQCGYVFCGGCIESYIAEECPDGRKRQGCRECNKLLSNIQASLPKPPSPGTEEFGLWRGPSTIKYRGRGDDVNRVQPKASKKPMFLDESDREPPNKLMPSAKLTGLVSLLTDWCKRYPNDKIIDEPLPAAPSCTWCHLYGIPFVCTKAPNSFHDVRHQRPHCQQDAPRRGN